MWRLGAFSAGIHWRVVVDSPPKVPKMQNAFSCFDVAMHKDSSIDGTDAMLCWSMTFDLCPIPCPPKNARFRRWFRNLIIILYGLLIIYHKGMTFESLSLLEISWSMTFYLYPIPCPQKTARLRRWFRSLISMLCGLLIIYHKVWHL